MAVAVWAVAEETSKDVLSPSVGDSSARAKKRTCFMIARLGSCHFESGSHNPEVVGSNPAPATRKRNTHRQVGVSFSVMRLI